MDLYIFCVVLGAAGMAAMALLGFASSHSGGHGHDTSGHEAHGERLVREPAQCRDCGFAFSERTRTTKPSRCPQCKSEQLAPPVFEIR